MSSPQLSMRTKHAWRFAQLIESSLRTHEKNAAREPDNSSGCWGLCHPRICLYWLQISPLTSLSSCLSGLCAYMVVCELTWLSKIVGLYTYFICTTQPPYASLVHVLRRHRATNLSEYEPRSMSRMLCDVEGLYFTILSNYNSWRFSLKFKAKLSHKPSPRGLSLLELDKWPMD